MMRRVVAYNTQGTGGEQAFPPLGLSAPPRIWLDDLWPTLRTPGEKI